MSRDIVFNDLSSLSQWCIDVIEEECLRFRITDTNDFDMVLNQMRNSFGNHTVGQDLNGKFVIGVSADDSVDVVNAIYAIYGMRIVYVFLTETDDDKLLITLSTDHNIVP